MPLAKEVHLEQTRVVELETPVAVKKTVETLLKVGPDHTKEQPPSAAERAAAMTVAAQHQAAS